MSATLREPAPHHVFPPVLCRRRRADPYSTDLIESYRRAAAYVDKILRGARPGDLPVEPPTKFERVVNLRAAKALGLTIPPLILLRADQVIELLGGQ